MSICAEQLSSVWALGFLVWGQPGPVVEPFFTPPFRRRKLVARLSFLITGRC